MSTAINTEVLMALETQINTVLDPSSYPGQLRDACHQMLIRLEEINSIENLRTLHPEAIFFENGKAIDPFSAAHCIIDYYRTTTFIRGLYKSIIAFRKKYPKKKIHICYAGTGPFAILMLPLTFKFSPEEICFSLMEIHPITQLMLNNTMSSLGLMPYVREFIFEDASTYRFPEHNRPDIMITETMQLALRREMQVPITFNLAPQMNPLGIFIPQSIRVKLGRVSTLGDEKPADMTVLIDLMVTPGQSLDVGLEEIEIIPDQKLNSSHPHLCYFTEIDVFEDETIRLMQSGLTMPLPFLDLRKNTTEIHRLYFKYQIDKEPGFVFRYI